MSLLGLGLGLGSLLHNLHTTARAVVSVDSFRIFACVATVSMIARALAMVVRTACTYTWKGLHDPLSKAGAVVGMKLATKLACVAAPSVISRTT